VEIVNGLPTAEQHSIPFRYSVSPHTSIQIAYRWSPQALPSAFYQPKSGTEHLSGSKDGSVSPLRLHEVVYRRRESLKSLLAFSHEILQYLFSRKMFEHIYLLIAKILNGESLLSQCCSPAVEGTVIPRLTKTIHAVITFFSRNLR